MERCIRDMVSMVKERGITVRREKLARGSQFRVKSGDCSLEGEKLLFVDKRLPPLHQLGFLLDYIREEGITLSEEELSVLPPSTRQTLSVAT